MRVQVNLHRGFTLIELLVAIAIVGILAGVVVLSLSGNTENADDTITKSNLRNIIPLYEELYVESQVSAGNTSLCRDSRVQAMMDGLFGSSGTFHTVPALSTYHSSRPYFDQDQYVASASGLTRTDLTGCVSTADDYVVWAELTTAGKMWCYDSSGGGREVTARIRSGAYILRDSYRVGGNDNRRVLGDGIGGDITGRINCRSIGL